MSEKVFTDIYYDTKNFSLTSNDKWLRSRTGKFELKPPLHKGAGQGTGRQVDQYNELEDEQTIKKALNLPNRGKLSDQLEKNGYSPFCVCKTTRTKYQKGQFIVDLDSVDYGDFSYNLGEVELQVSDESKIAGAIKKIMTFTKEQKLAIISTQSVKKATGKTWDEWLKLSTNKAVKNQAMPRCAEKCKNIGKIF